MLSDNLSVELDNVDWLDDGQQPMQPCLLIEFDGPEEDLKDRFRKPDGSGYTPDELDISYRFQSTNHPASLGGVFSFTDRVTGDYLFEVVVDPTQIETLTDAVRQYADVSDGQSGYEVEV